MIVSNRGLGLQNDSVDHRLDAQIIIDWGPLSGTSNELSRSAACVGVIDRGHSLRWALPRSRCVFRGRKRTAELANRVLLCWGLRPGLRTASRVAPSVRHPRAVPPRAMNARSAVIALTGYQSNGRFCLCTMDDAHWRRFHTFEVTQFDKEIKVK